MTTLAEMIEELVEELRDAVDELDAQAFDDGTPEARLLAGIRAAIAAWDDDEPEQELEP
jgi:hypothetical protein